MLQEIKLLKYNAIENGFIINALTLLKVTLSIYILNFNELFSNLFQVVIN